MKIIQNLKNGENLSLKCNKEDIKKIIIPLIPEITRLCKKPLGFHKKGALAVAHCQIQKKKPLRFFITVNGFAVVNPHINEYIGKSFFNDEGCMSFAEKTVLRRIRRWKKLIVSFTHIFENGEILEQKEVEIDGKLALIFQHEIDHFNGKHIF